MRFLRKKRITIPGAALLLLLVAWWIAPAFIDDPMTVIERQTPVRIYRDADGEILLLERTYDYQWRIPIPLQSIPLEFLKAICAVEDKDFFRHSGVSYPAVLRAFWCNLFHLHHRSGASTITMQLVSLPQEGRKKSYGMKLRQMLQARKLERLYTKERILYEYANRIPFGLKCYGIEAASWYYFDKPASMLLPQEAILLAGIPQKPNRYRPSRSPQLAKERQRTVLNKMVRLGRLSPQEADAISAKPLLYRNFATPSRMQQLAHSVNSHYLQIASRHTQAFGAQNEFILPLKSDIQQRLLDALVYELPHHSGIKDAAAVLLDSRTSSVLAFIGTMDFFNAADGQVNAAIARRSAGSTLKPFIYAEAIDAGFLNTRTILQDTPMRIGEYTPVNFDGNFSGHVTATEALGKSLNIPALRLLQQLGYQRMLNRLEAMNLMNRTTNDAAHYGLTLALGTAGHSLLELTAAYACLAHGGLYTPPAFIQGENSSPVRIFSEGAAVMTSLMLRERPLPNSPMPIAWKTGTSNGLCDAWCFAYTPDYTLGLWFGNKTGRPAPDLVGATIAAPVAGRIMTMLHTSKPIDWPAPEDTLTQVPLCSQTGLIPSSQCRHTSLGWVMKAFATPDCKTCTGTSARKIKILSPKRRLYLASSIEGVNLLVTCDDPKAEWYIDNTYVGTIHPQKPILFAPGPHKLHAIPSDATAAPDSFAFNVQLMLE